MTRYPHLSIHRFKESGIAKCAQCHDRFREWTRERARQHAGHHGHVVHFVVEDVTVYDGREVPSGDAARRRTDLVQHLRREANELRHQAERDGADNADDVAALEARIDGMGFEWPLAAPKGALT